MSYLLCRQCNGYYELKQSESPQDFETCCCGGPLRYIKSISRFYSKNKTDSDEDYGIDNTVIIYNNLRSFKNRLGINSDYYSESDEYYQNYSEYGTESEYYADLYSTEQLEPENIEYLEEFQNSTLSAEYPKHKRSEDHYGTSIEYGSVEQLDSFVSNNPNLELEENYENSSKQEHYQNTNENTDYFDNFGYYYADGFSIKKYLNNHVITMLGFGILPLQYYFIFGDMPLNMAAAYLASACLIMTYLPRNPKIEAHTDVKKVCSVWVIYFVVTSIMLLMWIALNLAKIPIIYI